MVIFNLSSLHLILKLAIGALGNSQPMNRLPDAEKHK